ncbi:MAG: UDP-2,3-diacylglucosamine diphosphatase [Anaerohalosphaeraceae bacterium]
MSQDRPIFVVSDLHMGDGGPRDNFAADHKAEQFSRFLDYVEQEGGELFILGDLFEFWQANVGRVIVRRMDFLERFARMGAIYVVGNHDADLEDLIGTGLLAHPFFERMTRPFERTIGMRRFKFMHGHELDPFNRDGTPRWGRVLAILCGMIEDRKGSPLLSAGGLSERALLRMGRSFMWMWNNSVNLLERSRVRQPRHRMNESLTPAQDPAREKGILALYQRDRLENGYDVLVAGHTHHAVLINGWYCNSGCWVGLRNSFLRIEPDGTVRLWGWKDNQPVEPRKKSRKPLDVI